FFFCSRCRHTRSSRDWSSDVCSPDLAEIDGRLEQEATTGGVTDPQALQERLAELLAEVARPDEDPTIDLRHGPTVIMVCGINGKIGRASSRDRVSIRRILVT